MRWQLLSLPLVGALIGWITNVIAIRMLFRPRRAFVMPLLGLKLQGLLPMRQNELAASLGEVVEKELLSPEDLWRQLNTPEMQQELMQLLGRVLSERLREKLPFLPPALRDWAGRSLEEAIEREAPSLWLQLEKQMAGAMVSKLGLAGIVEERVRSLDLNALESLAYRIASHELRYIEVLGAVLGLVIGLLQALALYLWPAV